MKILNFSLIWLSLLLPVISIQIEESSRVYLDAATRGATCGQVYSNGDDAYITVEVGNLYLDPKKGNITSLSIPIAIFKYSHIAFYDDFPTYDEFNELYNDHYDSRYDLYDDSLHFDISDVSNFYLINSLGSPVMFVDNILDNHHSNDPRMPAIKLRIDQSGIYCVYVVPPPIIAQHGNMSARVTYINSYGYLRYQDYLHYRSLISSIILGTVIFIVIYYYAKPKGPKPPPRIAEFSNLYKVILYFALAPLIVVNTLKIIPYAFENRFPDFRLELKVYLLVWYFCRSLLLTFVSEYLPSLFFLGYGVYDNRGNEGYDKKLHLLRLNVSLLFLFNIFSFSIGAIRDLILPHLSGLFRLIVEFVGDIFTPFADTGYSHIWRVFSFLDYCRTLLRDDKFPPHEDPINIKCITRAFNLSFIVINFTSYILENALCFLNILQYHFQFDNKNYYKKLDKFFYRNIDDVHLILNYEFDIFKEIAISYCPYDLYNYIVLLLLFVIWYRTSKVISTRIALKELEASNLLK